MKLTSFEILGAFANILDVQNKKFTTVRCTRGKHTEFYMWSTSQLGNIFDFYMG